MVVTNPKVPTGTCLTGKYEQMTTKFVVYLRVSTARQGQSGLGLEAQRQAVAAFVENGEVLAEYIEVESGKKADRPQLMAALAAAKRAKAKLVVAKLDRLSRDAFFLFGLQKAGVAFVCADMPDANELTIGIMAVVAQAERKMIAERTKAAMQRAKANGRTFGNLESLPEASRKGTAAVKERSQRLKMNVLPVIREIQSLGVTTLEGIAAKLNERGLKAPRGGEWHKTSVLRVLKTET